MSLLLLAAQWSLQRTVCAALFWPVHVACVARYWVSDWRFFLTVVGEFDAIIAYAGENRG